MHKINVLVLGSAALSPIIEHVFRNLPEFEITGGTGVRRSLGRQPGQLLPELIVVSVKPATHSICRTLALIKESSPASKVIVVCSVPGLARAARRCGADAYLSDEKLAGHLLPMARSLLERSRPAGCGA